MSDTAISVKSLGKKYYIHQQQGQKEKYLSLRESIEADIAKACKRIFSKEQEFTVHNIRDFWALKDVSLEIKQGSRVGVIGSNGAGKSTFLKLLSRITEPTTGEINIKGRVSSLLEVGTGFHPELTGKENIYLNGSILGMRRAEINKKFDQIVAFAEVENFLDVPVKRYSSGMYVRLAFSVAAHLEPEILIIDEVLSVGDERFQKKCLGKIEKIGNEGRTIVYVSHQLSTVSSLCNHAILLNHGEVASEGAPSKVIFNYLSDKHRKLHSHINYKAASNYIGDNQVRLTEAFITNTEGKMISEAEISQQVKVHMRYEIIIGHLKSVPNFHFYRSDGTCAFVTSEAACHEYIKGEYLSTCLIPKNFLNDGVYFVGLALTSFEKGVVIHFFQKDALVLNMRDSMEGTVGRIGWSGVIPGAVRPQLEWETCKNE
jgi:lipopolysaccharide transport system ATP-binding protein